MPPMNTQMMPVWAYASQMLGDLGLGSLAEPLQQYLLGQSVPPTEAEFTNWLYQQPAFHARFPAIKAMAEAGKQVPTPAEILDYEQTLSQILTYNGLNQFFNERWVRDHVTQFVVAEVSPEEVDERINKGWAVVKNAPPSVREAMGNYFGVENDAALLAYYLDPSNDGALLKRETELAQLGGAARQFGIDLSRVGAEKLQGAQVDYQQALQGMAQVAALAPVFAETMGEAGRRDGPRGWRSVGENTGANKYRVRLADGTERFFADKAEAGQWAESQGTDASMSWVKPTTNDLTAEEHGVGAIFGTSAEAMELLRRRLADRKAALSGGGGANVSQRGVGVGTAE